MCHILITNYYSSKYNTIPCHLNEEIRMNGQLTKYQCKTKHVNLELFFLLAMYTNPHFYVSKEYFCPTTVYYIECHRQNERGVNVLS